MALITTIRNNSWILVVVIGFALAAFILMDFSGQGVGGGGGPTDMGTVAGKKLDINEFNRAEAALYPNAGGDVYGRRSVLWDYFVEEAIVEKEAEALGLSVSADEMMELQFGNNLSPIMSQRFRDPNTGQVNREQLSQIRSMIEGGTVREAIDQGQLQPSFPAYWSHQMKEIKKDRLQSKLNTLVQKSIYTPSWMAEMMHNDGNQKMNFNYVKIPFDDVDASGISVTDSELQSYLNENKAKFVSDEETRRVSYATFNIVPTKKDSTDLYETVAKLLPGFNNTDDDSLFVDTNYGTISNVYFNKSQVSSAFADKLFTMAPGTAAGPFVDGRKYTIVKLLDRKTMPDSVDSRHILINAKTDVEYRAAFAKIDSLKNLIEAGSNSFEELARAHSQGPSGPKGGNLGYSQLNKMVKPFNDLIFYEAEKGKVYPVVTNFGVHLVEVLGYKFIKNEEGVKFATISESIIPSDFTQKQVYNKALEFAAKHRTLEAMATAAEANPDIKIETSAGLKKNDFFVGTLGAGEGSRSMVKWAYSGKASKGVVSSDVYEYQDPAEFFDNKYVIAGLKSVQKAGSVSIADVRDEIEPIVLNQKRGEAIKGKISGQSLGAIASSYNSQVDTITGATFNSSYLPELGSEPNVLAAAYNMEANATSQPIVGNNGIYVIQLLNKTLPTAVTNLPQVKKQASSAYQTQVGRQLIQAMKKTVKIKDSRSTFY